MKKRDLLVLLSLLLCCVSLLVGCRVETLPTPSNLRFVQIDKELVWDHIYYATGGYIVEINDKEYTTENNWLSTAGFETGTYTARVKALTIDKNYYRHSSWSKEATFSIRKESGVEYRLINNGSEYEVSSIGTAYGDVVIFDSLDNGIPITSIGDSAFSGPDSGKLSSITILGNSLRNIGDSAFSGCSALTRVVLPESVLTIGASAFQNCRSLSEINLPKNLVSMGIRAFQNTRFVKIDLPDSIIEIPAYAFAECITLEEINIGSGVATIDKYAFYKTQALTEIAIPGNVVRINDYAFTLSSLETFSAESGLRYIEMRAFYFCASLSNVMLPDTIVNLGTEVFYGTQIWENAEDVVYVDVWGDKTDGKAKVGKWVVGVKDVEIASVVLESDTIGIAEYTFYNCVNITSMSIPASVMYIGRAAYLNSGIWNSAVKLVNVGTWIVGTKDITMQDARIETFIVGIASFAFAGCTELKSINMPANIKSIGRYAFFQCYSVDITLPSAAQYIGENAFRSAGLSTIVIPSGIKVIEDYAFYGCSLATALTINQNVEIIGNFAFSSCSGLTRIIIPDNVHTIGDGAFRFTAITSIVIPEKVTAIANSLFYSCDKLQSVTFLGDVTSIGDEAFYGCIRMEGFKLPENLTSIGYRTFGMCYFLDNVVISDSVTRIGEYAFADCYYMTNITLPKNLTKISRYTFLNCYNLTQLVIPDSVTSIDDLAFANCTGLKSVIIGDNVIGMGKHVFYGCDELTIYASAKWRQPYWSEHWNSSYRPVIWQSQLSENSDYVVSVYRSDKSVSFPLENTSDYGNPYRAGYYFDGWTLVAPEEDGTHSGSPEKIDMPIAELPNGTTVYAIWLA